MATGTCSTCGLPSELCICEDVVKQETEVSIDTEERRFDKCVTLVSGLDPDDVDVDDLCSELKSSFGCGGTIQDDGTIELQGDHTNRVREELQDQGYTVTDDD